MSNTEIETVETIETEITTPIAIAPDALSAVNGGGDDGYNSGDLVRGGAGGLFGLLTGGPIGGVVGAGAGFMSRKVGQLADGVQDLMRERQRGQELEAKRQELLRRQGQNPPPNP
jgi:hypothetical protein